MHWYASVTCEVEIPVEASRTAAVGIDMGVKKLCALSDGSIAENPDCLKQHGKQLARLQRRLAGKQKAKITAADTRKDHAHKTTTAIAKNHGLVALEDLRVKAMSKSAKGSIDNPGRKVRRKSGLNRVILDAGWGEFRRQLEYKVAWVNGIVIAVDPKNTSRMCSACGHSAVFFFLCPQNSPPSPACDRNGQQTKSNRRNIVKPRKLNNWPVYIQLVGLHPGATAGSLRGYPLRRVFLAAIQRSAIGPIQ